MKKYKIDEENYTVLFRTGGANFVIIFVIFVIIVIIGALSDVKWYSKYCIWSIPTDFFIQKRGMVAHLVETDR